MGKKTPAQFKKAFDAIKKPGHPVTISGSDKDTLEKAIDAATSYKGVDDMEAKMDAAGKLIIDMAKKDPQYTAELMAYKYVKHIDTDSKRKPVWATAASKKLRDEEGLDFDPFEKAMKLVAPNDASDDLSRHVLERALISRGGKEATARIFYDRDPDAFVKAVLDKWQEHDAADKEELRDAWANATPSEAEPQTKLLSEALKLGKAELLRSVSKNIANLKVPDDFKTIAAGNEAMFITEILPTLKAKNDFVTLMSDATFRMQLKANAGDEWNDLVEATPMLKVLDIVEKQKPKNAKQANAALFDAVTTNEGIALGYRTVSEDPNRVILSGGTKADKKARDQKKAVLGDSFPDIPSTQCHSLLEVMETLMNAWPGTKPEIDQGTCDNMALTVPLSEIPGTGLLDKTFGGNVFDDDDASLNRVLFTGDSGINSHTWIVVDGVAYDPVLGTRGNEVRAAVAAEPKWMISDRVAKLDGGNYIVTDTGTPKPKANSMGFTSAYRMTKTPAKYLTDAECQTLGIEPLKPDQKGKGKGKGKSKTDATETV